MTLDKQGHLTGEALDDVLIGSGTADALAHLDRCPDCRARVEDLHATIGDFNQASFAWSQARSALPRPVLRPGSALVVRPVFALAIVFAALAAAVGPAAWHYLSPRRPAAAATASPQLEAPVEDSDAQIAEDNDLMKAVNAAIAPDERAMMNQFQLETGSPAAR